MTRSEVTASGISRARQAGNTELDPYLLDEWIDEGAQKLRHLTHSNYISVRTNLEAGRSKYCAPNLYKIIAIRVLTLPNRPGGTYNYRYLWAHVDNPAPGGTGYNYAYQEGVPSYVVFEGHNNVRLEPMPTYTLPNALVFDGYASDLKGIWQDQSDECPLPDDYVPALCMYLAWQIADHLGDTGRAQSQKEAYLVSSRILAAEAGNFTPAHRHVGQHEGIYQWPGTPTGENPLNL